MSWYVLHTKPRSEKKVEEEREPDVIVLKKDIKLSKNDMLNTTFKNKQSNKLNKTSKHR